MNMKTQDLTWATDDVTLAAWLKLEGFDYFGNEWRDDDKCYWRFEDSEALADAVAEYFGGTATGNLKEYNGIIAALKKEMYSQERERGLGRHSG